MVLRIPRARRMALLGFVLLALAAGPTGAGKGPGPALRPPGSRTAALPPAAGTSPALRARLVKSYGKIPLHFEENRGQADAKVRFLSRGPGYTLFFTPGEAVLSLRRAVKEKTTGEERASRRPARRPAPRKYRTAVLRMKLLGAKKNPKMSGRKKLPGKSNYFLGSDPQKWRTNVPNYAQVEYRQVYPGVDLIYYGSRRRLEYDFVVSPGADPAKIRFQFKGAEKVRLDKEGNLILHTPGGEIVQKAPIIYQEVDGVREKVAGGYVLLPHPPRLSSSQARPLLKGEGGNPRRQQKSPPPSGRGLGGGMTFPPAPPPQPSPPRPSSPRAGGGGSLRVRTGIPEVGFRVAAYDRRRPLVIDPQLVWSTYLGGGNPDVGNGIAVDAAGNAYVTGGTNSTDFPTANPLQAASADGSDAFVVKVNAQGTALVWSTYLGGGSLDVGVAIAVDAAGNAYVTGGTNSTDFPGTAGSPIQNAKGGEENGWDAFVTKLNASGTALVWSTYLGAADSLTAAGASPSTPPETLT